MNALDFSKTAVRTFAAVGALTFLTSSAYAADANKSAKKYATPRTEFGQPDLRGVWSFSSDTPLERPPEYKNREFLTRDEIAQRRKQADAREKWLAYEAGGTGGYNQYWLEGVPQEQDQRTSLIIDPPDGRLPPLQPGVKPAGGDLEADTPGQRPVRFLVGGIGKDGPEDRGLSERCLKGFNSGPPFSPSAYNNNIQIFQSKNTAVVMTEMIHEARVVPLDSRPRVDPALTNWTGDSRGHWEGDTLVVETTNFSDKITSFRNAGNAAKLKITERFTRTGPNQLEYRYTIDDPATYTKTITAVLPMVRTDGDLYEYACHEGNYGMTNILAGAREEERKAAVNKK